jgi:hypothetical protein
MRGWALREEGTGLNSLIDPHGNVVVTSRHDAVIEAMIIDWHAAANWPTLFAELPRGTMLVRPPGDDFPGFACCGCNVAGALRFCNADDEMGKAVIGAWISFALGKKLGPDLLHELQALIDGSSGSPTIH